jgi:hypothetical protein
LNISKGVLIDREAAKSSLGMKYLKQNGINQSTTKPNAKS